MDVPESSKHGKKSTSQKLEDQKKVGKSSVFILPSLLSNALLFIFSCCVCVCMRAAFFFLIKDDLLWLLLVSSCRCMWKPRG